MSRKTKTAKPDELVFMDSDEPFTEPATPKPKNRYGGYHFTTVGHLDIEKCFTMIGKVAGETYGRRLELVAIHTKDDPDSDTRLGYLNEPANKKPR